MKPLSLTQFLALGEDAVGNLEDKLDTTDASRLVNYRDSLNNNLIDLYDSRKLWLPSEAKQAIAEWLEIKLLTF